MEELKRFENELKNSKDLQAKMEDAFKRIAEEDQTKNEAEVMVAAAKELGYEISITALEKAKSEAEELDSEALKEVAGGSDEEKRPDECYASWHCTLFALHTDDGSKTAACFWDYVCTPVVYHFLDEKREKPPLNREFL